MEQPGVRLAVSNVPGGGPRAQAMTGMYPNHSIGYYALVIDYQKAVPGDWYVWVVGPDGSPISDPQAAHITTNKLKQDNESACWRAVVNFFAY